MTAMDIAALRVALANGFLNRRSQVQFLPGAPSTEPNALEYREIAKRQTRQTQQNAPAQSPAHSVATMFTVPRDSTAAQEGDA